MAFKLNLFKKKPTADINTNEVNHLQSDYNPSGVKAPDQQSLTSTVEKPLFSFKQSFKLAQQSVLIAPKAMGQLLSFGDSTKKLVQLESKRSAVNNAINNLSGEYRSFVAADLNRKKEKLDKKIGDLEHKSGEKLEKKQDKKEKYLNRKSDLKQTWGGSIASEKATSIAMLATLPVTAPLAAGISLGIGAALIVPVAIGYGGYAAAGSIKNTEKYQNFKNARNEKDSKYEIRKDNYTDEKNQKSASKATTKVTSLLGEAPTIAAQAQHPKFRETVATVRGAHIVRDIPLLGLGSKYDNIEDQKPSRWSGINLFSLEKKPRVNEDNDNLNDIPTQDDDITDFERFQARARARARARDNANSMPQIEEENEDAQSEISSLHTNNGQNPLGNYSNFDSIPLYEDNNNKAGSIVTAIHHQNDEDQIETIATQRPNGYSKFREEL